VLRTPLSPQGEPLMTDGQKVVTAYFALSYGLPMIGNALFHDDILSSYKIYPLTRSTVALLLGVYGFFLVLSTTRIPVFPPVDTAFLRPIVRWGGRLYLRSRLAVGLVALPVGVVNLLAGLTSYRYASESISETNSPLLLLMILINTVISVDLFYSMFVRTEKAVGVFTRRYVENILLSITLVVSASGIQGMFEALVSVLYCLFPETFRRLVFVPRGQGLLRPLRRAAVWVPVLLLIFSMAWYVGQFIKASSSIDVATLLEEPEKVAGQVGTEQTFLTSFFYYLIERRSIYYYSLLYSVEASRDELSHGAVAVLAFPLETLGFRVDHFLGGFFGIPRPVIGSISQLNYKLLTADQYPVTDRTGSSPGLVAAFNYVLGFPLNVILCALFARWVARWLNYLVQQSREETLSIVGVLLVLESLRSVFQSPFDYLVVIDESLLQAGLLLALFVSKTEPVDEGSPVTSSTRLAEPSVSAVL
jgi:hypothetical protein